MPKATYIGFGDAYYKRLGEDRPKFVALRGKTFEADTPKEVDDEFFELIKCHKAFKEYVDPNKKSK